MFSGLQRAAWAFGPWCFRAIIASRGGRRPDRLFFFGEAHIERSPIDLHTIEFLDCPFCTGIIGHRDKTITFAFPGVFVGDNRYRIDRAVRAEQFDQFDLLHVFRKTNDE
jgi:hypothetical protein